MKQRRSDAASGQAARRRAVFSSAGLLAIVLVSGAAAIGLAVSHDRAKSALEDRYTTRATLAAAAVQTYTSQLMDSEARAAGVNLVAGTDRFATVVSSFGFSAAVLLDSRGAVLAVHPIKASLLGKQIAAGYPHLKAAVGGVRAISPVVPAASTGQPVVGFAVPFETPSGRRVFSGAYQVSATPLHAYLRSMVSLPTSRLFLVDDKQRVLASSLPLAAGGVPPTQAPAWGEAERNGGSARVGDEFIATQAVAGTPWLVVATISQRELLRPVTGRAQLIPWLILAMLFLSALWVWVLLARRYAVNLRLREAFAELDRVSRQDGLTGARTRRSTEEALAQAREQSGDSGSVLSVLMVDVDHFKRINDTFGHLAGDDALIAVAARLQAGLRQGDVLGRWGGEEFLVVLPDTDSATAAVIAERLRLSVAAEPIVLGSGGDGIDATVSVGVTSSTDASPEVLVHAADQAMYAAKEDGRNCVRILNRVSAVVTTGPPADG